MIYNEEHNYDKTTCISRVDGKAKQKHVVSMKKQRKFSNHLCLRLKYIAISLRKENMQVKYTTAVLPIASILQQII
jgi:hypothetical protein